MIRDYSFSEIEKYLRTCSDVNETIFSAVSDLTDAAVIFTPLVLGPQFLPLLDMLETKDRLLNLGKKVCDAIVQKIQPDYIQRTAQIKAAYGLICYTAYFDCLQEYVPEEIIKKLKLSIQKKKELLDASQDAVDVILPPYDAHCEVPYADHITSFPELKEHLSSLYARITRNFCRLVENSGIFKDEETDHCKSFQKRLDQLPNRAVEVYEAQYIELANKFSDFAQYAQLQNVVGVFHAVENNAEAIKSLRELTKKIDVGLRNLNSAVNAIPSNYHEIESQDIVDDLKKKYSAIIHEPIIDNKEIAPDSEAIMLRFPQIIDAFIPQRYKCMSYRNKDIKLEDIPLWKKLPSHDNINEFFIKYLYSPDSIDNPLIILGHPGSGKSLLTKILAAQLMSTSYTVVRIPLREVSADDGIDVLVEDQIKKLTNRPLPQGYGGFAAQFTERPLLIILDGYDELLQAKGDVFSGYLGKVQKFQQDQKSMNRPVRVIVTSRITLIDKARIPLNSTIVRLLEFSSKQQQAWINIWNHINIDYFASNQIKPFSLPERNAKKTNSVLELAEQPLLLLMLAMYDSEANELAEKSQIQRTELYDNLLRRFIRRERGRYIPDFSNKPNIEQRQIIDQEMNRLGVVAIGMYNRQDVVIHSKELDEDLSCFKAHRSDGSPAPHTLKEAESVLGSFFFIHQSSAKDTEAHSDNSESAYEFLHNTFGEFLASDFILRNTITEVMDIYNNLGFRSESDIEKLTNPDAIRVNWYYCLMFVPLYSRPVIVEMLREHWSRALDRANKLLPNQRYSLSEQDFLDALRILVRSQLKMVLNGRRIPEVMRNGVIMGQDTPLLGYLSTHSLNLIILISALIQDGYVFDESEYIPKKEPKAKKVETQDTQPWNKLTSLWRTFYSNTDLVGLSVVLTSSRSSKTTIRITCNKDFVSTPYDQPVEKLLCVSSTLADDLLTALSGMQSPKFKVITKKSQNSILELLGSISNDMYAEYQLTRLRYEMQCVDITNFTDRKTYRQYKLINDIIYSLDLKHLCDTTLLSFIDVINRGLDKQLLFFSTRRKLLSIFFDMDERIILNKDNYVVLHNEIETTIERLYMTFAATLTGIHNWDYDLKRFLDRRYKKIKFYEENPTPYSRSYPKRNLLTMNSNSIYSNKMEWGFRENLGDFLRNTDAIKVLTLTEPGVLTNLLVENIDFFQQIISSSSLELFFELCFEAISENGLMCYDPTTLEELFILANHFHITDFIVRFSALLSHFVNYENIVPKLFYSDMTLLLKLIENMPDVFTSIPIESLVKYSNFERSLSPIHTRNLIDCIGIFHLLSTIQQDGEPDNFLIHMSREIDFNYLKNIDYRKLTVKQLEDLWWFAELVGRTELINTLKNNSPRFYERKKAKKGLIDFFNK